jgi:hypothetical protein
VTTVWHAYGALHCNSCCFSCYRYNTSSCCCCCWCCRELVAANEDAVVVIQLRQGTKYVAQALGTCWGLLGSLESNWSG